MMAINRKDENFKKELSKQNETPMIQGYKMIKATPLRENEAYKLNQLGKTKNVEQSPMITWGKIEGTMFLGNASSEKKYRLPDTPNRDEIGFRMAS